MLDERRSHKPGIHCSGGKMELTTLRRPRQRVNHLITMSPLEGTKENDLPLALPVRLERMEESMAKTAICLQNWELQ